MSYESNDSSKDALQGSGDDDTMIGPPDWQNGAECVVSTESQGEAYPHADCVDFWGNGDTVFLKEDFENHKLTILSHIYSNGTLKFWCSKANGESILYPSQELVRIEKSYSIKVNDRVELQVEAEYISKGMQGVVTEITDDGKFCSVKFDGQDSIDFMPI